MKNWCLIWSVAGVWLSAPVSISQYLGWCGWRPGGLCERMSIVNAERCAPPILIGSRSCSPRVIQGTLHTNLCVLLCGRRAFPRVSEGAASVGEPCAGEGEHLCTIPDTPPPPTPARPRVL